jgi:hypothetical protein
MLGRIARMLNPVKALRAGWGVAADARRAGAEYGMSALGLAREQVALQLATGMPRDGYYRLGLYDRTLSWEEKKTFVVGERLRPLWHRFTPPRYHHLFKNKFLFKHLFLSLGFPVARLYGVFDPQWGRRADGAPLCTAADVADLLTAHPDVDLAVKPVESAEGNMVLVFKGRLPGDPRVLVTLAGRQYGPEELVRHMTDEALLREAYPGADAPVRSFLLEERVRPHPEVAALCGETLCCVRVVTFVALDGHSEVLGAGFKLQVRPSSVDNLAAGGMAVSVHLQTGVLGEGVLAGANYVRRYREHPETGLRFYGYRLPLWGELTDLALRAALAFPLARAVGWDIAISPDGPLLIEGNPAFGGQLPQTFARHGLLSPSVREFLERSGQA